VFEKFTQRARNALALAQQEAQSSGFDYIGTEFILLGLVLEGEGIAGSVLRRSGLDPVKLREAIEVLTGKGDSTPGGDEMALTPRTKRVFELAFEATRRLGHNYVGTEHLLLGIIWEGDGLANRLLSDFDIRPETINQMVMSALQPNGVPMPNPDVRPAPVEEVTSSTPAIDHFGHDLMKAAADEKLDPVVGRSREIERLLQILSRRTKNNPVLIGDPGVGKTAIVEGLAQKIYRGEVPEILLGKRVVRLDLSLLVAGAKYRGEFEDRLNKVLQEIKQDGNIIVFIDELHTIIGAGAAEGAMDAANILKPALSRGEFQCIGATTINEYRKYIEKDSALERRFQPIHVDEPTEVESLQILHGLRDRYEAHHQVKILDEALEAAVSYSTRYIPDRFLPDKAIDLIDEASAKVRLAAYTSPPDLKALEKEMELILKEKEEAVSNQEFEKAASLRDSEVSLRERMESAQAQWQKENSGTTIVVTKQDIAQIVAGWTRIPVQKFAADEGRLLINLEEELHKRVIGQDEAVIAVAKAIRRARAGLKDPKRPVGSFIFLGPTGVGKTELGKALADVLFGSEDAMIRVDMSEYMEKHTVSRLIGSPPGYIGHDEGGQLTDAVRRRPYSVVLLDEIEKAHPDVFNTLLQVLDDGRLTDNHGRTADFRNTIIIMTSNVGSNHIQVDKSLGFVSDGSLVADYARMKGRIVEELKRNIKPEFFNRLDEIIVFHALTSKELSQIVEIMLSGLTQRLAESGMRLHLSDDAKAKLVESGTDLNYGARPLKRSIQRLIEDPVSDAILLGRFTFGSTIYADLTEKGDFVFTKNKPSKRARKQSAPELKPAEK